MKNSRQKLIICSLLTAISYLLVGFSPADFRLETDIDWIYGGGLASSRVSRVKMSAVGDLMVHERQEEDANRRAIDGVPNFHHSFSEITRQFRNSDIVVGNFETVLFGHYQDYPHFSVMDEFARALRDSGFTHLGTANNHSLDHGETGLFRTLDVLEGLGIQTFGTYRGQSDRDSITITEINGIRLAFLAYSHGTNGIPALYDRGYLINLLDEELFTADIRRARALADFVIVMPHWGYEYESHVRRSIRDMALVMFDAGADIILGHHPHVVQPAEFVTITNDDGAERVGFVAYSMGNFISGQRTQPREAGVIFNIYFERAGDNDPTFTVSFIPTWVRFFYNQIRDIAVVSVYEVLMGAMWGHESGLSASDLNRVRNVHTETTRTITGTAIPHEAIAPEYFIFP